MGTPSFAAFAALILRACSAFFLLGSFLVATLALYRLFLHPLAAVPGPRLAAVSNAWHAYHARNGLMFELGTTLHARYGPVVRVGPNEVWLDSKEAFRTIYSPGSGFDKSDFYLATALRRPKWHWRQPFRLQQPDPTLDFLSERDKQRYRLQRRLVGPLYQMSNLKKYEGKIDAVLHDIVARLRSLAGAEVDLKEWMHIIAVECLGAVVLSWSPGYAQAMSDGGSGAHTYKSWRKKSVLGLFPLAALAEGHSKLLTRLLGILCGVSHKVPENFKPFFPDVTRRVTRRVRVALGGKTPREKGRQDLLAELIELHQAKPATFTETYLRRLAMTNFGAGHETMCSALTAALAMVGSHAAAQQRIAHEVLALETPPPGSGGPISYDSVARRLPYTLAAIREAQRLHPAIGMSLPRTVPPGVPCRLHGLVLPPGTTVGCNPVALHRNRAVFGPDAEDFRPDRWLDDAGGEVRLRDMLGCNLIWGGGARTCPGRHLAELIVHKAVPLLVREFDVRVAMPPRHRIRYYFVAMLTGVTVRFLPRGKEDEGTVDGAALHEGKGK